MLNSQSVTSATVVLIMHSGALKHCTDAVVVRAASGHF